MKKAFIICRCDPMRNGGKSFNTYATSIDPKSLHKADRPDWIKSRRQVWSDGTSLYYIG